MRRAPSRRSALIDAIWLVIVGMPVRASAARDLLVLAVRRLAQRRRAADHDHIRPALCMASA